MIPKIISAILNCSLVLTVLSQVSARTLEIGTGKTYSNLEAAAQAASAGDTLLFYPGVYAGGQYVENLHGSEAAPIVIKAGQTQQVIIRGGGNAWQLSDPAFVHITGFIFEGQTGNGVNIDDGGDYATPAHDVVIADCFFRDMNASGNNDLLKLSGLDNFRIENCNFINGAAGGSGIDMVGCHHGEILANHFEDMGSNAIQAKGGSQFVRIQANWFENCGQRSLNLGGSTGLPFFRPLDAPFEAADLEVYANVFVGSVAPVAYVGCVRVHVINNTIVNPERWVVRILQETVDPSRFAACGDNSFQNNLIYQSNISTETNVGPNTRPGSFLFKGNFWYNFENPSWSGPSLPVVDPALVVNADPLFQDLTAQNFGLQANSPAIGLLNYSGEPKTDYAGATYNSPRSAGAFEGSPATGILIRSDETGKLFCGVFPNPGNGAFTIRYSIRQRAHSTLRLFDIHGRQILSLLDKAIEPGEYQIAQNVQNLPSGVYFYQLENGRERAVGKLTLLR